MNFINFIIKDNEIIPIDIGTHDESNLLHSSKDLVKFFKKNHFKVPKYLKINGILKLCAQLIPLSPNYNKSSNF